VIARTAFNCAEIPNFCINSFRNNTMEIRPMVALRAALVGGVAAFAKIAGAMKAAGSVKVGAAAVAVTAAATAAVSGKDTANDNQKPGGK
jgi:hypothetical protein